MRGERDAEAIARMTPRIAAYTGHRCRGGQEARRPRRHQHVPARAQPHPRHGGERPTTPHITAYDPSPASAQSRFSDPVLDAIGPPLTSAMTSLYQGPLKWRV